MLPAPSLLPGCKPSNLFAAMWRPLQDRLEYLTLKPPQSNNYAVNSVAFVSTNCNSSTLIRCATLLTIPKICGVASTSTLAFILRRPKATNVLLAVSFLSIPLFICVTLMRFIIKTFWSLGNMSFSRHFKNLLTIDH